MILENFSNLKDSVIHVTSVLLKLHFHHILCESVFDLLTAGRYSLRIYLFVPKKKRKE